MGSRYAVAAIAAAGLVFVVIAVQLLATRPSTLPAASGALDLPSPRTKGPLSLEEALAGRRSVRDFSTEPLTTSEIGQILWAGQGVTDAAGRRTAPSAGGLYPLELYVVSPDGVFHYLPDEHALATVRSGDRRPELGAAAFDQPAVRDAPLVVIVTGVLARSEAKYGPRATRYVQLEAGHAAQNLLLQAVTLGLGAVPIGAFDDARVAEVLVLPAGESPLYLVPVGHPL